MTTLVFACKGERPISDVTFILLDEKFQEVERTSSILLPGGFYSRQKFQRRFGEDFATALPIKTVMELLEKMVENVTVTKTISRGWDHETLLSYLAICRVPIPKCLEKLTNIKTEFRRRYEAPSAQNDRLSRQNDRLSRFDMAYHLGIDPTEFESGLICSSEETAEIFVEIVRRMSEDPYYH